MAGAACKSERWFWMIFFWREKKQLKNCQYEFRKSGSTTDDLERLAKIYGIQFNKITRQIFDFQMILHAYQILIQIISWLKRGSGYKWETANLDNQLDRVLQGSILNVNHCYQWSCIGRYTSCLLQFTCDLFLSVLLRGKLPWCTQSNVGYRKLSWTVNITIWTWVLAEQDWQCIPHTLWQFNFINFIIILLFKIRPKVMWVPKKTNAYSSAKPAFLRSEISVFRVKKQLYLSIVTTWTWFTAQDSPFRLILVVFGWKEKIQDRD